MNTPNFSAKKLASMGRTRGGIDGGGGGGGGRGRGRRGFKSGRNGSRGVVEISTFCHASDHGGEALMKRTCDRLPLEHAPIYLENKTPIGCVDKIYGPYFTMKTNEGTAATSFFVGQKFFIDPASLGPMLSFIPEAEPVSIESKSTSFEMISAIHYKPDKPIYSRGKKKSYVGVCSGDQPVYLIDVHNMGKEKIRFERLSRLHSMSNILGTLESEKPFRFILEYGVPLDKFTKDNPLNETTFQCILQDIVEAVESLLEAGFFVSGFKEIDFYILDSRLLSAEQRLKTKYASFQKCKYFGVLEENSGEENARVQKFAEERRKTLLALSKLISRICKNVIFSTENKILLTRFITDLLTKSKSFGHEIVLKRRPFFWSFYKRLEWYVELCHWIKSGRNRKCFDKHKEGGDLYDPMGGKPFDAEEGWQTCIETDIWALIEYGLAKNGNRLAKGRLENGCEATGEQQAKVKMGGQAKCGFRMKKKTVLTLSTTSTQFTNWSKRVSYLVQGYRNLFTHGRDRNPIIKKSRPFNDPKDLYTYFSKKFPALLDFSYRFAEEYCKDTYLKKKYDF